MLTYNKVAIIAALKSPRVGWVVAGFVVGWFVVGSRSSNNMGAQADLSTISAAYYLNKAGYFLNFAANFAASSGSAGE